MTTKIMHVLDEKCPLCRIVDGDRFKDVQISPSCEAILDARDRGDMLRPDDCSHRDKHKRQCLECGKDCTEDIMAAAYDFYKDARKYGG